MAETSVKKEHERRFFPDIKTFSFDPTLYEETFILQGYLEDGTRYRDSLGEDGVHTYTVTRKKGKGISRDEDEKIISKTEFDACWKEIMYHLTKSRYFVDLEDQEEKAEVNLFHGSLRGYIQIEVEFDSHEKAVAFIPPEWFGEEVTNDKRHGNYYLAKKGCQELLV